MEMDSWQYWDAVEESVNKDAMESFYILAVRF